MEGECRFEEALRKAHRGGCSRGEVAAGAAPGGRAEGEADVDPQSGRVPVCLRSGQGASAALESEGQRVGESAACRPSVTRGSWRLRGGRVAAQPFRQQWKGLTRRPRGTVWPPRRAQAGGGRGRARRPGGRGAATATPVAGGDREAAAKRSGCCRVLMQPGGPGGGSDVSVPWGEGRRGCGSGPGSGRTDGAQHPLQSPPRTRASVTRPVPFAGGAGVALWPFVRKSLTQLRDSACGPTVRGAPCSLRVRPSAV